MTAKKKKVPATPLQKLLRDVQTLQTDMETLLDATFTIGADLEALVIAESEA